MKMRVRSAAVLVAVLQVGSCSTGDDQATDTTSWDDKAVSELVAVLADPAAVTDCELDPSGYPALMCGFLARNAAESLGDKGDPAAVPALAAAVRDPKTFTEAVDASWEALEKIGGPEVIAELVEAITAAHPTPVPQTDPGSDPQRGHDLLVAERAADLLGRLGGVEHIPILAVGGGVGGGCTGSSYFTALVTISAADATPLLPYLETAATRWVYGPLIAIGQSDTQDALIAALPRWGDSDMAECFLNSGNPTLEQAAQDWAAAHGYMITRLPGGGSVSWGSG